MRTLILKIAVVAASLWVTIWLLGGLSFDGNFWSFLLVSFIFVVVNTIIRPIVKLISLPFIILTLGILSLVINALAFLFVAWLAGPNVWDLGFTVDGFWAAFFAAIIMGLVGFVLNRFVKKD